MRQIALAISLAAFSTALAAQNINWGSIVQQGVNEVIRSMNTPAAPAQPATKPVYQSPAPPSPPPKAAKTRSAKEKNVNARIADMLGKPAEFQAFLKQLKKEVAAADKHALAKMMRYPLSVALGNLKIFTEQDFTDNYDNIFTPAVVAAVKNQTYADLFVRDSGAAVGGGILWFTGVCVDDACKQRTPKVVGINSPSTDSGSAGQATNLPSAPARPAKPHTIAATSLPIDPMPGERGPCRNLPAPSGSGLLTITGILEPDATDCYRLSGRNGQKVHIKLVSVSLGFSIAELIDNRSHFELKTKNQTYDILLADTFPGPTSSHYELRLKYK